jgi:hypothetical protein
VAFAEYSSAHTAKEAAMSWLDKLLGREKKTAGEMTGDSSMEQEGMGQEQGGMDTPPAAGTSEPAQDERESPPASS